MDNPQKRIERNAAVLQDNLYLSKNEKTIKARANERLRSFLIKADFVGVLTLAAIHYGPAILGMLGH